MDDRSLDLLLDSSAPATDHDDAGCLGCHRAASVAGRRPRRPRAATVALVSGVCVAAGATAAAAGVVTSIFDDPDATSVSQSVGDGDTCVNAYRAVAGRGGDRSAVAEAVVVADELIAGIDFATLDLTDELALVRKSAAGSALGTLDDAYYETEAQYVAVVDVVRRGLAERGFAGVPVDVQGGTSCAE